MGSVTTGKGKYLRGDEPLQRRGRILLELARSSLERELGRHQTTPEAQEQADGGWLHEPGAVFVTLLCEGRLRGCIGSIVAIRPLIEDIRHNAVAAALRDPRFRPLTRDELDGIQIEVSLLSAPAPLSFSGEKEALSQLRPGTDGVVLEYRNNRATFLPQMWEVFETAERFMSELKTKAGLATDFWHRDLKMERYTVVQWSERSD